MIKKLSILLLLAMVSCNKALLDDTVYTLEADRETKSINCRYTTIPIICGDDIVTIESIEENTNQPYKYAFVKISPNGEKTTKEFQLNWTLNINYDEEKISDPNYKNNFDSNINLIKDQYNYYSISTAMYNHTKFTKNSDGDFMLIITDTDNDPNYNVSRLGIIKFDPDGNIIYKKLEYNVDMTLTEGFVQTAFALNNGGYAVVYEYPNKEEDNYDIYNPDDYIDNTNNEYNNNEEYNTDNDEYTDSNEYSDNDEYSDNNEYSDNDEYSDNNENEYEKLYIETYDANGNKISQNTLKIGNDILVNNGVDLGNTILLTSSDNTYMIDMEGNLQKQSLLGCANISNIFTIDDKIYISWSNSLEDGYGFSAFDINGNEILRQNYSKKNSVLILNASKINGENYFSGYIIHDSRWAAERFSYTIDNNIDAIILSENSNTFNSNVINNDNDIVIFGITQNANGSYNIYYDTNTLTNKWNNNIYIYTTNDLNMLYSADDSFLYEDTTEENSDNNTDSYEY